MDLLTDAIVMGESPRWHDGRLYVADWGSGTIVAVDPDGKTEVAASVTGAACFDFRPDGRWLVVDGDRLLVGTPFGRLEPYADLSVAGSFFNDIVVDGRGNAYVGALGFDFGHGAPFAPGTVALVRPSGEVLRVADDVAFPNGVAMTADNGTLVLAESYGNRLTAWDVAADGTLSGRRAWAESRCCAGTLPTRKNIFCKACAGRWRSAAHLASPLHVPFLPSSRTSNRATNFLPCSLRRQSRSPSKPVSSRAKMMSQNSTKWTRTTSLACPRKRWKHAAKKLRA